MHPDLQDSRVGPRTACVSANARVVSAAARGDQAAWNQLVDRYTGLLWAVARGYRLSTGDAADVVQTTWLRLVEHLADVRNPDGLGAWLATTTRREALRALRRTSRSEPSDEVDELPDPCLTEVDARLLQDERDAAVSEAFERLPLRDQALLRLLTADPAPCYEEISAALAMPIGSIGPTRGRALERMRRELRRAGALDLAQDAG